LEQEGLYARLVHQQFGLQAAPAIHADPLLTA
jgi:hypothetical protein